MPLQDDLKKGEEVFLFIAAVCGITASVFSDEIPLALRIILAALCGAVPVGIICYKIGLRHDRKNQKEESKKSLHNTGITGVYRLREYKYANKYTEAIQGASSDVFFSGNSLGMLEPHIGLLEKRMSEGVRVRLVALDACNTTLVRAVGSYWGREEAYLSHYRDFLTWFAPIRENYPETFAARVCNHWPVSAMMIDGIYGNLEVYMRGWRSSDERFLLTLDFTEVTRDCRANLERIWEEATVLGSQKAFDMRINVIEELMRKTSER